MDKMIENMRGRLLGYLNGKTEGVLCNRYRDALDSIDAPFLEELATGDYDLEEIIPEVSRYLGLNSYHNKQIGDLVNKTDGVLYQLLGDSLDELPNDFLRELGGTRDSNHVDLISTVTRYFLLTPHHTTILEQNPDFHDDGYTLDQLRDLSETQLERVIAGESLETFLGEAPNQSVLDRANDTKKKLSGRRPKRSCSHQDPPSSVRSTFPGNGSSRAGQLPSGGGNH